MNCWCLTESPYTMGSVGNSVCKCSQSHYTCICILDYFTIKHHFIKEFHSGISKKIVLNLPYAFEW